ncbi:pantoate--beta-alanine ligase [Maribacter sp. 1_2014MBL_MicDiv]|uniref:pantoate--beta-alanine ligase n=1 Tax=Maribacter sp. 1_2014MBL_MicDiv TaxID=1644130 RepID=UPI0008F46A62|nr:pantoate--beta-alanine ligase [Maribacter sp. 1_2014MBL_MicDiv]APA64038.1 pantothenate synthetase [Maribacter sp. 1_2014MBL_MicDiv]
MQVIKTKKVLTEKLNELGSSLNLGLVPTMGALHQGHASLIKKAVSENDKVVVSIFVNPTQFNNLEDLNKYPKTLDADLLLISEISEDIIVFTPEVSEIYPETVIPKIYDFEGLEKVMEGEFRDDHFNGVGTIVEELLIVVHPTKAYFGEKDFQQLRIIQKLTEIRQIPVEIIGCEIVREDHGLAMSSRNERLSKEIRQKAAFIYETLKTAKNKFGTDNVLNIKDWVVNEFKKTNDFELEYFDITDVETLTPVIDKINNIKYRAFIAVYVENVRLIDNIALN